MMRKWDRRLFFSKKKNFKRKFFFYKRDRRLVYVKKGIALCNLGDNSTSVLTISSSRIAHGRHSSTTTCSYDLRAGNGDSIRSRGIEINFMLIDPLNQIIGSYEQLDPQGRTLPLSDQSSD